MSLARSSRAEGGHRPAHRELLAKSSLGSPAIDYRDRRQGAVRKPGDRVEAGTRRQRKVPMTREFLEQAHAYYDLCCRQASSWEEREACRRSRSYVAHLLALRRGD
jgi:hypothetical protein